MGKLLKIEYGGVELFNAEIEGQFSWTENPNGGISISTQPPRVAGATGGGTSNPVLQGLADSLKSKAKGAAAQTAAATAEPPK